MTLALGRKVCPNWPWLQFRSSFLSRFIWVHVAHNEKWQLRRLTFTLARNRSLAPSSRTRLPLIHRIKKKSGPGSLIIQHGATVSVYNLFSKYISQATAQRSRTPYVTNALRMSQVIKLSSSTYHRNASSVHSLTVPYPSATPLTRVRKRTASQVQFTWCFSPLQ